jgi:hypothetical protein
VDDQEVLNPRYAATQAGVDSYVLVNGRLAYRLLLGKQRRDLRRGENLADSDYEVRRATRCRGAACSGGFTLQF